MSNYLYEVQQCLDGIPLKKWVAVLLLFCLLAFFAGLDGRDIEGADEPRIAGIAREIVISRNWTVPSLNGTDFLETPPLFYWCTALSIKLFGPSNFSAKFTAACCGTLGVFAIFMLMIVMRFSYFFAFVSALALGSSIQYWGNSRKCMTDIMLAAFIALAMTAFYAVVTSPRLKYRIRWFMLFVIALSAAVMSKALIGLAIPCSALFCWLMIDNVFFQKRINWPAWGALFGGAFLALFPLVIWLISVYHDAGYEAVYTIVWTNNIGRFTGSHAEHMEPFYYYLKYLPLQLQPWTILLVGGLIMHLCNAWKRGPECSRSLFMLCWLLVPLMMMFVASGKRNVYLLPLYGAEAIIAGSFVAAVLGNDKVKVLLSGIIFNKISEVLGWVIVSVAPVFMVITILIGYSRMELSSYLIWAPLIAITSVVLWYCKNNLARRCSIILALAAFLVSIDTYMKPLDNSEESFENIFMAVKGYQSAGTAGNFYLYRPSERVSGAAVFYLGRLVPVLKTPADLVALEKYNNKVLVAAPSRQPGLVPLGKVHKRVGLYRLEHKNNINPTGIQI